MCCSTRRSRIRLPSSMSGLPDLRCFIFFAVDLFILVLPSFGREGPEQMIQGFPLIYNFKFAWMDEFVLKLREFCGIEGFHQPVDHVSHPRDAAAIGMIRQQNIVWPAQLDLERYYFAPKRAGVCWKHAGPGAIGDGPVVGAADVGFHHQQVSLGTTGNKVSKASLAAVWAAACIASRCLTNSSAVLRGAVSLDVFLAGKKHQMYSA